MIRIIFPLLCAAMALLAAPAFAQAPRIAADAPDTYIVQRGDTLWGISGRFLEQPWRWPEVWRMNREQIRNPHLIYPGQVVVLDRNGPHLSIGRVLGEQQLSPQAYSEALERAIPSIPLADIEPFLNRPLIVDEDALNDAGLVVATENKRVYMGGGDTVFATNIAEGQGESWQLFRPAKPLIDPVTKEKLGYEANFLGTARLIEDGGVSDTGNPVPATLQIISAVEEIGPGDRLVQAEQARVLSYVPRAPEHDIEGRLIDIYRGVSETGRHNVVTLNIGSQAGLEVGHVLALHRERGTARHKIDGRNQTFDLPNKRYGVAFVFRVFDRVAYALVMDTDGQVTVGDTVHRP